MHGLARPVTAISVGPDACRSLNHDWCTRASWLDTTLVVAVEVVYMKSLTAVVSANDLRPPSQYPPGCPMNFSVKGRQAALLFEPGGGSPEVVRVFKEGHLSLDMNGSGTPNWNSTCFKEGCKLAHFSVKTNKVCVSLPFVYHNDMILAMISGGARRFGALATFLNDPETLYLVPQSLDLGLPLFDSILDPVAIVVASLVLFIELVKDTAEWEAKLLRKGIIVIIGI
ncbi:hypothetical protein BKA70DRAFT_1222496 [Coprinopsis sp. MPI-PUGE-AT-0042]|nr:hypothetical protein BKA70DRAFT_1222496 [Coprinopsis sp. MPI-PUGE-AT-0042]